MKSLYLATEGGEDAAGGRVSLLPCLNINNSTEPMLVDGVNRLSSGHRKTAYALKENVQRLANKYGIERVGFLTLTFADHVTCAKEASRRYNSLNTHVISQRYEETIAVLERMKSGRIHFHLLVVMGGDIRTGFDFEAAEKGVYSSAGQKLRAEWAFWRKTAKLYGFGRTEMLPVKSTGEAIAKYVGKYIAKHIGQRESRDKGVRLVRYSRGACYTATRFQFQSQRSRLWRHQVALFAKKHGCQDEVALAEKFGARWAWNKRAEIMAIEPTAPDLFELFNLDQICFAIEVGKALGITTAEAYASLYQRDIFPDKIAFTVEVPFVEWSPPVLQIETARIERVDVTTVWN